MIDLAPAFQIACDIHGGEFDKAGQPYLFHVMRVSMAMETPEERVVGVLHDAIEHRHGYSAKVQLKEKIVHLYGDTVLAALVALTHDRKDEAYMQYIQRLSTNPLAVKVKIADLCDNSRPWRLEKLPLADRQRLSKKYSEALEYLLKVGDFMPKEEVSNAR